jgi:hypothetical protein
MLTRLVERSYFDRSTSPSPDQIEFWLRELRTAQLLIEVARAYPDVARRIEAGRSAIAAALRGTEDDVALAVGLEESEERRRDRDYWRPLRAEIEQLRRSRASGG